LKGIVLHPKELAHTPKSDLIHPTIIKVEGRTENPLGRYYMFMGHPYAKTPNIDRLASRGTVFMQHYVTGVTCTPSRTGIMTGVHPARYPCYPRHYGCEDQTTITQLLNENGHAPGHFGKWHMGPDESVGTHGYNEVFTESNNRNVSNTASRDESLTDKAIHFMERTAREGRPSYVNVWGHSTH
jgi:N-acetylgalactosamine-6-sulfatase